MVSKAIFYNETAKELIEEWISNRRFIEEELGDGATDYRTKVCSHQGEVRRSKMSRPALEKTALRLLKSNEIIMEFKEH